MLHSHTHVHTEHEEKIVKVPLWNEVKRKKFSFNRNLYNFEANYFISRKLNIHIRAKQVKLN